MKNSLRETLDLFTKNYVELNAQFFEQQTIFAKLGAYLITAAGRDASELPLGKTKEYIASVESRFDGLAGDLSPLLTAYVAVSADPEKTLLYLFKAYRELKSVFMASPHIITAACMLEHSCKEDGSYGEVAASTAAVYEDIGADHPFVTGYEDIPVCALYALTENTGDDAEKRIEDCAAILSETYRFKNSVQALTHTLALFPDTKAACAAALEISDALAGKALKLGSGFHISAIGALTGVSDAVPDIAADVDETLDALKAVNGFRVLELGSKERLMWASMLVSLDGALRHPYPAFIHAVTAAFLAIAGANTQDSLEGVLPT